MILAVPIAAIVLLVRFPRAHLYAYRKMVPVGEWDNCWSRLCSIHYRHHSRRLPLSRSPERPLTR